MDLTQALFNKLTGDATLVSLLSSYPTSGSPQFPAVFTAWPVPPDAARPYVYTRGSVADVAWDELAPNPAKGGTAPHLGRDISRDVFVIGDNHGSETEVETIAERIRALLHRGTLAISDGSHVMSQCAGPVTAETDDSLTARRLSVRIVAVED